MFRRDDAGKVGNDELNVVLADLAWWFGWPPSEINEMDWEELLVWVKQMKRQVTANYIR